MKKLLLLAMVGVLMLAGCTARNEAQESSANSASQSSLAETGQAVDESEPDAASSEVSETNAVETIMIPEGSALQIFDLPTDGGTTKVEIYLPSEWEMNELDFILDGNTMAAFHSVAPVEGRDAALARIESEYAHAEYIREIEGVDGWQCLTQETIEGTTAFKNEIRFFVVKDDKLLEVSFFPQMGVGIGTQSSHFIEHLKTVNF